MQLFMCWAFFNQSPHTAGTRPKHNGTQAGGLAYLAARSRVLAGTVHGENIENLYKLCTREGGREDPGVSQVIFLLFSRQKHMNLPPGC